MITSTAKTTAFGLALALAATAAVAQDAAAPAAPPAAAPATPPAAPAAPPATDQAAAATQIAAPAAPPPVLPTSGDPMVIDNLLEKVCKPMVAGGDFTALVKANGLKKVARSDDWSMPLAPKSPFTVVVQAPGTNKNVCQMTVRYAPGADDPILQGLNVWRFLHEPQLHAQRRDIANYPDAQRVTSTWDNWENQELDGKIYGLVFVQLNKLDGTASIAPNYDEAVIKYSIRPIDAAYAASQAAARKAAADFAAAQAAAKAKADADAAAAAAAAAPPGAPAAPGAPTAPAT